MSFSWRSGYLSFHCLSVGTCLSKAGQYVRGCMHGWRVACVELWIEYGVSYSVCMHFYGVEWEAT
jgi:hypothetical protein